MAVNMIILTAFHKVRRNLDAHQIAVSQSELQNPIGNNNFRYWINLIFWFFNFLI